MRTFAVAMLGIFGCILLVLSSGWYYLAFDLDGAPRGSWECESTSPQGTYTIAIFRTDGSAITFGGVRGEVVVNDSGARRTFFRDGGPALFGRFCEVSWESDQVAVVFDQRLDVTRDTHGWRR